MGLLGAALSALRSLLCCCLRPAAREVEEAAYDDDTRFEPKLLEADAGALRAAARAAWADAQAASQASQRAYATGDHAVAGERSRAAAASRAEAQALDGQAARAVFAQTNTERGLWTLDLHGLQVAEAEPRVERRLAACDAAAAAAGPAGGALRLVVVFGKGNHSEGGRARLRPAVVALLRRARPAGCVLEGEPNAGCATVVVAPPPPGGRLQQARL